MSGRVVVVPTGPRPRPTLGVDDDDDDDDDDDARTRREGVNIDEDVYRFYKTFMSVRANAARGGRRRTEEDAWVRRRTRVEIDGWMGCWNDGRARGSMVGWDGMG